STKNSHTTPTETGPVIRAAGPEARSLKDYRAAAAASRGLAGSARGINANEPATARRRKQRARVIRGKAGRPILLYAGGEIEKHELECLLLIRQRSGPTGCRKGCLARKSRGRYVEVTEHDSPALHTGSTVGCGRRVDWRIEREMRHCVKPTAPIDI